MVSDKQVLWMVTVALLVGLSFAVATFETKATALVKIDVPYRAIATVAGCSVYQLEVSENRLLYFSSCGALSR
jgi:hypothetical protein